MVVFSATTDSMAESTAHILRADVGLGSMTRCTAPVWVTRIGMSRPGTTTRASQRDAITAGQQPARGRPVRRAEASLDQQRAVPLPRIVPVLRTRAAVPLAAPAVEPAQA